MKTLLAFLAVSLFAQDDVNSFSLEKERALGQHIAAQITRESKSVTNPAISEYVNRIGGALVSQLKDNRFEYHFEVIADDSRTEPLPVPGGYVLIPVRAFLAAQDEAEFVGVLAHAIGHVVLRHGTRTATRGQVSNLTTIPLVFMGGWAGAHADSHAPQLLVPLGFLEMQRTYELEADQFGVGLAAGAGYDGGALLRYVQRTQSADSNMSPLPPRELRLAKLRETVSTVPSAARSSSDDEFRSIRESLQPAIELAHPRIPTLRR